MPERLHRIYGPDLDADKWLEASKKIEETRREHSKPVEGEIEHAAELKEVIASANEFIRKKCIELGVPVPQPIVPEHIHFLPAEQYRKRMGETEGKGCSAGTAIIFEDQVYIAISPPPRLKFEDLEKYGYDIKEKIEEWEDEFDEEYFANLDYEGAPEPKDFELGEEDEKFQAASETYYKNLRSSEQYQKKTSRIFRRREIRNNLMGNEEYRCTTKKGFARDCHP